MCANTRGTAAKTAAFGLLVPDILRSIATTPAGNAYIEPIPPPETFRVLYLELAIVTVLIVINGLLSMSELAIVSSRPGRLAGLVERGVSGSRRALALASDPGKFLSTVQIGITLIGVLSGAFSGATLGQRLSQWLVELGLSQGMSDTIGVGLVVGIITYASLIVGELVPKQIALRDPESIAVKVARDERDGQNLAAAGLAARPFRQGAALAARP